MKAVEALIGLPCNVRTKNSKPHFESEQMNDLVQILPKIDNF